MNNDSRSAYRTLTDPEFEAATASTLLALGEARLADVRWWAKLRREDSRPPRELDERGLTRVETARLDELRRTPDSDSDSDPDPDPNPTLTRFPDVASRPNPVTAWQAVLELHVAVAEFDSWPLAAPDEAGFERRLPPSQ